MATWGMTLVLRLGNHQLDKMLTRGKAETSFCLHSLNRIFGNRVHRRATLGSDPLPASLARSVVTAGSDPGVARASYKRNNRGTIGI